MRWVAASTRDEALAALGISSVDHRCPRCGSTSHGRPFADGIGGVSLSTSGGLVLAAVAEAAVGIDHEPLTATVDRGVVAHPSESADPLRLWVRKEALLKAAGLGLNVPPESFWVEDDGRPGAIAGYDGPALVVRDLDVPGYVAAVAVTQPLPPSSDG